MMWRDNIPKKKNAECTEASLNTLISSELQQISFRVDCMPLQAWKTNEKKDFIPFALSNFILMMMLLTIFALLFFMSLSLFFTCLESTRLNWNSVIFICENLYQYFLQNINPFQYIKNRSIHWLHTGLHILTQSRKISL